MLYNLYSTKPATDILVTNPGATIWQMRPPSKDMIEHSILVPRTKSSLYPSNLSKGLFAIFVCYLSFLKVNNIPPSICSDKKEDDMKCIANIVLKRMEKEFPAPPPPPVEIKPGSTGNAVSGNFG